MSVYHEWSTVGVETKFAMLNWNTLLRVVRKVYHAWRPWKRFSMLVVGKESLLCLKSEEGLLCLRLTEESLLCTKYTIFLTFYVYPCVIGCCECDGSIERVRSRPRLAIHKLSLVSQSSTDTPFLSSLCFPKRAICWIQFRRMCWVWSQREAPTIIEQVREQCIDNSSWCDICRK